MVAARRILVVGPSALAESLGAILPGARIAREEHLLAGVWRAAREDFECVLLDHASGEHLPQAISAVRELERNVHLLVCCPAHAEPLAREWIAAGVHDYVLEPLMAGEVRAVMEGKTASRTPQANRAAETFVPVAMERPSNAELSDIAGVLRHLSDGPQTALARMAETIRDAFGAAGVSIRLEQHSHVAGDASEALVKEPLRVNGAIVGEIGLSRRKTGAYDAGTIERLGAYARLLELTYSLARQHDQLRDLVWTDDLSGLRNRRYFDRRLAELVDYAARERGRVTVVLLDIDDFKQYNDAHGHDFGDKLLREVAQLLLRTSRESDVVTRYGGDEFALILWDAEKPRVPGSQHPTSARDLAERFCRAMKAHRFECLGENAPGPVTLSGGLASFPWDGKTEAELMRAADEALLGAKRNGKGRIQVAGETERC
ncbi:MAG: GGDEF domain-containing protein [Phycisphaerae bacterium]|nr:GGDEF domain-containing protein [Phycisphaerae bacterium]